MPTFLHACFVFCLFLATGCTSTAPIVLDSKQSPHPLHFPHAHVAVLSFADAPGHLGTGRTAREITTALLVHSYAVSLVSPSKVDAYLRQSSLVPSEYDLEALEDSAKSIKADVVFWGTVNQFTPYSFDRLAPATPPYVEVTIYGFRVGQSGVAKISGRKQGALPATLWSRQPTFEDVAQPLISQLLSKLQ